MKDCVAIIGRPNVGKSTLFNRLIGKRISIVDDFPGITRDRIYHKITWMKNSFFIIDTGGIQMKNETLQKQIQIQTEIAIQDAKIILFLVEGKKELTYDDFFIFKLLKKFNKKNIFLVANKLEGNKTFDSSLWKLGLEIFPISSSHGEGIGDLLDKVVLDLNISPILDDDKFRITIIGKPNVGKSTLLNALSKTNRSIVTPFANTTRDSVDSEITIDKEKFILVDTAGINRKSRLKESVEHYSLARAFKSMEKSNLILFMMEAKLDFVHFDKVIAGYAFKKEKPFIIILNKWDIIAGKNNDKDKLKKKIKKEFQFLRWAPIVFISALKKIGFNKLLNSILISKKNLSKKINTNSLNEIFINAQLIKPAPVFKGKRFQIFFTKQIENKIPTFKLFVNNKKFLHFSYERYLENKVREYYDFQGVPIKFIFQNKEVNQYDK